MQSTINFLNELLQTHKHAVMFFSSSVKKEEFHAGFGIDQDEALFTFTGTIRLPFVLITVTKNDHQKPDAMDWAVQRVEN